MAAWAAGRLGGFALGLVAPIGERSFPVRMAPWPTGLPRTCRPLLRRLRSTLSSIRSATTVPFSPALLELSAPVVAINPDHRPTDIEALGRYRVKTVLMSAEHFLMMEDPDTFNRLLTETVEEFATSSSIR